MNNYKEKIIRYIAVYCGMVLFYFSIVYRISGFRMIPCMVWAAMNPILYIIVVRKCNKRREWPDYLYRKQVQNNDILKRVLHENMVAYVSQFMVIYIAICLAVVLYLKGVNVKEFGEKIYNDIAKYGRDTIIGIIGGAYAFYFAVQPFIIARIRDMCQFFDPYDFAVIKFSWGSVVISIIDIVLYMIFKLYDVKVWLLGLTEGMWCLLFGGAVFFCLFTIISSKIDEKIIIRNIHNIYSNKEIYVLPTKRWHVKNVIGQINRLLKKYKRLLNYAKLNKIENIEFDCVFTNRKENIELAVRKYRIFVIIIFLLIHLMGIGVALDLAIPVLPYLFILEISTIPFVFGAIQTDNVRYYYRYFNSVFLFSTWGYYIKLDEKEKSLYILSCRYLFSPYRKLLLALKRLICFCNLALKMKYDDTEFIDDLLMKFLTSHVLDEVHSTSCNEGMILPILICSCLTRSRLTENHDKLIKDAIKRFELTEKERNLLVQMSLHVLRDIHGNDIAFKRENYCEFLDRIMM